MIFNISGFEILEKIGQGGMASVWKARQLSLDRIVAIKILAEGFSDEPEDVRRFQEEAQSAAKLKHPGIVLVHDANAENGTYYFVMEFVSGYTVGDWVRRKGVLSEKDALLVADCVADALGYAWERANIVHCDIKPDNIIIDEDGTVKVADLGLSRTISLMEMDTEESDEIMGTPAYISPEQAMGEINLDFRADIYSLGAMLYHLVTGKMMFEEFDDDETLDKQVNDTVKDPIDINSSLSKGICWLIERMTAKEPDMREDSWEAVRADIQRVRRGLLPKGAVLPEGSSTVRRSIRRTVGDYKRIENIQKIARSARAPIVMTTVKFSIIAIALAVAVKMYLQKSYVALEPVPTPVPVVVTNVVSQSKPNVKSVEEDSVKVDAGDDSGDADVMDVEVIRAKEMYDFAVSWQEKHLDDFDAAIEQFKSVVQETRGTKYSLMAQQRIRELESKKEQAIQDVVDGLVAKVRPLVKGHQYKKAISLIRNYDGSYADETSERRNRISQSLEKKRDSWNQTRNQILKRQKAERQKHIDALVMAILSDDLRLSIQIVDGMLENPIFKYVENDLNSVKKVLKDAADINTRIIESFDKQYGKTIDVYLVGGMRTLTIGSVSGDRVECRQMLNVGRGGVSTISIGIEDLSEYERLQRMGDDSQYEVALVKGIMAFQSQKYSHAEKYFNMTQPLLKKQLLMKLRGESAEPKIPEKSREPEPVTEPVSEPVSEPVFERRKFNKDRRFTHPQHGHFDRFDKDQKNDIFQQEDK